MEAFDNILGVLLGYVWGLPTVLLLCGAGLFFTIGLGLPQFRGFFHGIRVVRGKFDNPDDPGQITHFQALCTALSATVGLGNISGVAVAIHLGGPGAIFWMVVVGLLGMATKYSECTLAILHRRIDENGVVRGGPMYYIEKALGPVGKPAAAFFAVACIFASFGAANMFQVREVANILDRSFSIPAWITAITLATITGLVIIGGIRRIAKVASILLPVMAVIYVGGALVVILSNISLVPGVFAQILQDAFTGTAAVGGFTGIVLRQVIVQGVRRACFSNEAGIGTAPFAHAAAATKEPVREGMVAMLGPFIDTVVICTMTAFVILISGAWTNPELNGVALTAAAFDIGLPGFGQWFLPIGVTLFATSTILSWSYYGERASDYLFGKKGSIPYKVFYCIFAFMGGLWPLATIINFSDLMLGCMIVPNIIAVIILFPKIREETKKYFARYVN